MWWPRTASCCQKQPGDANAYVSAEPGAARPAACGCCGDLALPLLWRGPLPSAGEGTRFRKRLQGCGVGASPVSPLDSNWGFGCTGGSAGAWMEQMSAWHRWEEGLGARGCPQVARSWSCLPTPSTAGRAAPGALPHLGQENKPPPVPPHTRAGLLLLPPRLSCRLPQRPCHCCCCLSRWFRLWQRLAAYVGLGFSAESWVHVMFVPCSVTTVAEHHLCPV